MLPLTVVKVCGVIEGPLQDINIYFAWRPAAGAIVADVVFDLYNLLVQSCGSQVAGKVDDKVKVVFVITGVTSWLAHGGCGDPGRACGDMSVCLQHAPSFEAMICFCTQVRAKGEQVAESKMTLGLLLEVGQDDFLSCKIFFSMSGEDKRISP